MYNDMLLEHDFIVAERMMAFGESYEEASLVARQWMKEARDDVDEEEVGDED